MAVEDLYFRVKVGLRHSDGAKILERRLDDPRAYTHVPDLWDWFCREHPEGQVVGPDSAFLIARGSGWAGDADKFCAAMVAAGFLALVSEGFRVKGWAKWAGFHLTVRAKEAARKRTSRSTSEGRPVDVPGTSGGHTEGRPLACPGDRSLVSSLSSSSVGGVGGEAPAGAVAAPLPRRVSPGKVEDYPLTAAVLAALWERGWTDATWPAKRISAGQVEKAIEAVGVSAAANRLMLVFEGARREGREPKPWVSWHLDAIQPRTQGNDLRVGVAAPADHEAFGKGGRRAID